jgi:hypothetical protein
MRSRSIRPGVLTGHRLAVAWVVLGFCFVVLGVATLATGEPWIYVALCWSASGG